MRNLQNYRLDICETFVVGEIFIGMLLPQWLLSFILEINGTLMHVSNLKFSAKTEERNQVYDKKHLSW